MSAWIFPVHIYALLVPLILVPAIIQNESFLNDRVFQQNIIFYGVIFLMAGSFFEVWQNHIDEWYVTDDSASGNGYSLLDGLFSFSILVGQCIILYAFIGNLSLIKYLCLILILVMPIMYYKKILPFFASYYNRGSKYHHCISYFWTRGNFPPVFDHCTHRHMFQ